MLINQSINEPISDYNFTSNIAVKNIWQQHMEKNDEMGENRAQCSFFLT